MKKVAPRRRRIRRRERPSIKVKELSKRLLDQAEDIFQHTQGLDTAVRDSVANGLAYIVHAAYDCAADSITFPDTKSWMAFIDGAVAEWFRDKGFAEWYCAAAANLFNCSRPRIQADREMSTVFRRAKPGGRVKPRKKTTIFNFRWGTPTRGSTKKRSGAAATLLPAEQ